MRTICLLGFHVRPTSVDTFGRRKVAKGSGWNDLAEGRQRHDDDARGVVGHTAI